MVKVRNLLNGSFRDVLSKDLVFRVSVYGILIENDKLLVHVHPKLEKYLLPGGRIEKGEKIVECLVREFKEETGLEVKPTELVDVKEDFVDFGFGNEKPSHSILVFYKVERIGGRLGEMTDKEDSEKVAFIPVDDSLDEKLQEIFRGIF